jgi:hypothetical protein
MTKMDNGAANCLVLMPFGTETQDKLLYQLVYDNVILPACKDGGATGVRVDKIPLADKPIRDELYEDIKNAPLVLADLTGNNPNVLFELGMRAAHGKPFVLISMNPDRAVFWASGFHIVNYAAADARNKISEAVRQALTGVTQRAQRELALLELSEVTKNPRQFDNPFQDRLAAWRIARASQDVQGIQGHEWTLETRSSENYIAYMFTEVMNMLDEGDEYCTVTNMEFWKNSTVQESFLKANLEASLRGVEIRRVFLINREDWLSKTRSPALRRIIQQHVKASDIVEGHASGHISTRYLLSKNYSSEYNKFRHFGLARRRRIELDLSGSMLLEPNYRAKAAADNIDKLAISFPKIGNDSYLRLQKILRDFDDLFERSPDIAKLLEA